MKFIVLIALFAFASAALDVNAFNQGFIDNFGLSKEQQTEATNCLNSYEKIQNQVVTLYKNRDTEKPDEILLIVAKLTVEAKEELAKNCEAYGKALNTIIRENTNSETPLEKVLLNNLKANQADVTTQIFSLVGAVRDGKSYQAGSTLATVLSILDGNNVPTKAKAATFSSEKHHAKFDYSKAVTEFVTVFLKGVGIKSEETAKKIANCAIQGKELRDSVNQHVNAPKDEQKSAMDKVNAFRSVLDQGVEVANDCQEFQALFAPIVAAIKKDPAHFFLTAIHNYGLNAKLIQENAVQAASNIYEHNDEKAAEELVKVINTLSHGITINHATITA